MFAHQRIAIVLALPLVLAAGCDGPSTAADSGSPPDAPGDAGPQGAGVTLAFEHLANGAPIVLGTEQPYTNAAGNAFGVTRLHYFVSMVTLTLADGTELTASEAHYVDHETPGTLAYVFPHEVPEGELARISFVMGLPPALNVTGAFPSPPESLMEWPERMGGGYHYMKLEGRYLDATGSPFNYMAHSGGLGGEDYSFEVVLEAGGRQIADGARFTVEMHVEEWFANPDTWDLNDYFDAEHHGIMGNAGAQASLQRNGATVFTLREQ